MTIDERMDRLTGIVESLAASVIARDDQVDAHDRQLGVLIDLASKHEKAIANLEKQWQAYLNTLPSN